MADRATLHRTKLADLEAWLVRRAWKIDRLHSMPPYQVLRAWRQRPGDPKRWFIVYDRQSDHLSVRDSDRGLVESFIADSKRGEKP